MSITAANYNRPSVPVRFQQARQSLVNLEKALREKQTEDRITFEAKLETRARFNTVPVYSTRPTYEARDVYEERDVTEDRPVYETRPTYADRPTYETKVVGNRDLRGFVSATSAGLDDKADFSVQLGAGAAAHVRFTGLNIAVTSNGATQAFAYGATGPSFQSALTAALNSVTGLHASLDSSGYLSLTTDGAQSLSLSEVANGTLDISGTALDKLGLTAGTTNRRQTGTVREQSGTEQVQTGSQTFVVGRERTKTGSETVVTGSESYVSGSEKVENGTESVVVGYDRVVTTVDTGLAERNFQQITARQTMAGLAKAAQRDIGSAGMIGKSIVEGLVGIVGLLGAQDGLTADKLNTAVANLDKARAAYMTTAASKSGLLLSRAV